MIERTEIEGKPRVASEADHRQAEYFRTELCRQLALLDAQTEVWRAALARHERRNDGDQARSAQRELRSAAVERRQLVEMLDALDRRFTGGT